MVFYILWNWKSYRLLLLLILRCGGYRRYLILFRLRLVLILLRYVLIFILFVIIVIIFLLCGVFRMFLGNILWSWLRRNLRYVLLLVLRYFRYVLFCLIRCYVLSRLFRGYFMGYGVGLFFWLWGGGVLEGFLLGISLWLGSLLLGFFREIWG